MKNALIASLMIAGLTASLPYAMAQDAAPLTLSGLKNVLCMDGTDRPCTEAPCTKAMDYAVLFKLEGVYGQEFPNVADGLTWQQLGDLHWRARRSIQWANAHLQHGCIQASFNSWLGYFLENIQEAAMPQPNPAAIRDAIESQAQARGRVLMDQIPTPGRP